jgi:hypothetical protein
MCEVGDCALPGKSIPGFSANSLRARQVRALLLLPALSGRERSSAFVGALRAGSEKLLATHIKIRHNPSDAGTRYYVRRSVYTCAWSAVSAQEQRSDSWRYLGLDLAFAYRRLRGFTDLSTTPELTPSGIGHIKKADSAAIKPASAVSYPYEEHGESRLRRSHGDWRLGEQAI